MLSICIPIYNHDVTKLVSNLYQMATKLNVPFEIVCIDDCSELSYKLRNEEVCIKYGKYITLEENIGRSKIRNLFLKYTKYDYLLFLDCDSIVFFNDFLKKYYEVLEKEKTQVICGGRIYEREKPERQKRLRWKYGIYKESQPFNIRQENPNKSFMTNNFIIPQKILENVKFDERINQYGHEDTLFGSQLKKYNISVKHIDNPVLNGHLEKNSEYIKKTEAGLQNLIHVLDYANHDPELIKDITILKYYGNCKKNHLTGIIIIAFNIFKPLIKYLLSKGITNLFLFDCYKLGYFAKQLKLKNTNSKF